MGETVAPQMGKPPAARQDGAMPRVPEVCRAVAGEALAQLSAEAREIFELRLERWWPDILAGLSDLYSRADAQELGPRLVFLAACAYRDRDPELRRLDQARQLTPDWLQTPNMIGYAAYTERFAGTLDGVAEQLPYLKELGVTYLHLMPLLATREGDNDGGYAVADYRSVRPNLGTMADLRALTRKLRSQGVSLVLDLVLNHVAAEHDWALKARAGDRHHREYFHIFPDRTMPDAYEASLPEVFPESAPGSFTWDDDVAGWVWTTFNSWQWDLNWSNPEVMLEFSDIVLFLANAGVEVLRLDALAFMWKRLGTNCQGQPEVHSITQVLRALARTACPALAFKAEAIVGPQELVQYLGQGRFYGKVSDLAYHNSLMVHIWSMLATHDVRLAAHALRSLPPPPPTSTWITYLRGHDDIGWAIRDEDAAAVGLSGYGHRAFLSDWYTGAFPGSPARGLTFQYQAQTNDRRISGTAASLIGLGVPGSTAEVDLRVRALRLAHAIIIGWGGIPLIWSGDEVATLNDADWALEPGHQDDNRWVHRVSLDHERTTQRHDVSSVPGRVFQDLTALIQARRTLPHLHASVPAYVGDIDDPGVFVVSRPHPLGPFLALYNVTPYWRMWPGYRLQQYGFADAIEVLSNEAPRRGDDGNFWLPPYAAWWIVDRGVLSR
ncbi:MAG TPA: alpha-amylase family protein [Dermatophilaceae bacterium]|nr:alpha-amylase family protein [Dermatophilaceae bacterium]